MKKLISSIVILSTAMTLNMGVVSAQTVNSAWADGAIYFKLTQKAANQINALKSRKAKQVKLPFMRDIENRYEITDVLQPFVEDGDTDNNLQRIFRVEYSNAEDVAAIIEELKQNNEVEYAEAAPLFRTHLVPNDVYYNKPLNYGSIAVNASWQLNLINASGAWGITQGDPNIVVAVVDNAIYVEHPDLKSKVVKQYDVADRDNDPTPPSLTSSWAHGTHSSGLVAAETNNGLGVSSIGNRISLMAIKATKDADNPTDLHYALEGIVWAAQNGADIINMSFGTMYPTQTMQDIINFAYNKGCVLVASAGNDGINEPNYPAAFEHVIAVGSCDGDDQLSYFSNYGTWIDVLAPGGVAANSTFGILSTSCAAVSNVTAYGVEAGYETKIGTSMAAPIVSGLCGLMLSANPHITPEKLAIMLRETSDNIDSVNRYYMGVVGGGRINAGNAVTAAMNSRSNLTADFESSATTIGSESEVQFTDLSVGTPVAWEWQFSGGIPATSTERNPTVNYEYGGIYEVSLTVTDVMGNTDTEVKNSFIIVKGRGKTEWIEQTTNVSTPLRGVLHMDIVSQDIAWLLTFDGMEMGSGEGTNDFAVTTNGGNTWQAGMLNFGAYIPACVTAVSANTAWVSAYHGDRTGSAIFKTTNGGASWTKQAPEIFDSPDIFLNIVKMFNEHEGFCQADPLSVDGEFTIYTTSDGGATWQRAQNTPATLFGETSWTGLVTSAGEGTAWFGTNKGRVFRTTDKGHTWQVYTTPVMNVNALSFSDEQHGVLICNEPEAWGMFSTEDGGATWQSVNVPPAYIDDVVAVPGSKGMWVGIKSNSTTYQGLQSVYTMDGGATWTIIDKGVQYTDVCMFSRYSGWAGGFNLDAMTGGVYKWPIVQQMLDIPPIESEPQAMVTIYPNPARDILYIENGNDAAYEIIDLTGRSLISGQYPDGGVQVSSLDRGHYLIRIRKENNEVATEKFIKE